MARKKKYNKTIEFDKNDKNIEIWSSRIVELLNEQGLTQEELARKSGVSKGSITAWIFGDKQHHIRTEPKIKSLNSVAQVLGVSVDYLIGNTDIKPLNLKLQAISKYTGLSERSIDNLNTYKKYPDIIEFIDTIIANSNIFTNLSHYASEYFDSLRRCKELKEKYPDHLIESPHIHLSTNTETFSVDEKHEAEERELHGIYRNEVENVQPLQLYKLQNFFMDFIKDYGKALLKDGVKNG